MSMTDAERRAQAVAALRELADAIESDPTIPTPNYFAISSYLHSMDGTQAERFTAVHDFAEAHHVAVTVESDGRKAVKRFGPIELTVHAFGDERRKVSGEVSRADDPALTPVGATA
jgi:hypothetical protein